MRNQTQFTLKGDPAAFNQSLQKIGDVLSLLNVMTGVDHSKAQNDITAISVSIEIVADLLGGAYENLTMMTVQGGNND